MLNFNYILLQIPLIAGDEAIMPENIVHESYLDLILKGGWILLPIFLLSILAIYMIIYKIINISILGKRNKRWLSRTIELISENKIEQATLLASESSSAEAAIIYAGLKDWDNDISDLSEIENSMELEARIQLGKLDSGMSWLAVTASVAPMLGFLGTIFGVIKIFYSIAQTNDLSIATISTGLYEKMISSGSGLFVGIIAFMGYSLINARIDKIANRLDWSSNQVLKALKRNSKQTQTV